MKIWFMFDNHRFAPVEVAGRKQMIARIVSLFNEDGCGSIFVKDGDATVNALCLHGHRISNNEWGVPASEIEAWADRFITEQSFHRLMMA